MPPTSAPCGPLRRDTLSGHRRRPRGWPTRPIAFYNLKDKARISESVGLQSVSVQVTLEKTPGGSAQFSSLHITARPNAMTQNTISTRIVIATPDLKTRLAFLAALRSQPGFNVVGEAHDEAALQVLRRQIQPDILFLDSALAGVVTSAVTSWPGVRIILLAGIIDEGHVIQAIRLAAYGIVPRTAPQEELLNSIQNALADQYWLGMDSVVILVKLLRHLLFEKNVEWSHDRQDFTARERNIVAMIATGHSNKEIGRELSISERTVKHHLTSIFGKLGISSRLQLATFAAAHRLAPTVGRCDEASTIVSDLGERGQPKPASVISLIGLS
jgi:two-component system, NarL family, nitrate/nitrite response regulator NarL